VAVKLHGYPCVLCKPATSTPNPFNFDNSWPSPTRRDLTRLRVTPWPSSNALRMDANSVEGIASFPDDCLPPEGDYESRDALIKSINAWAAARGYAFVTGRSTKEKTGRQTVTYTCDRACRPPNALKDRQRKTTTRGTNCQFSVLAKESLDKSTWALRHRPDKRYSSHNHEPSQHPSAHPVHRILSKEDRTKLANLSNSGIAPKDIRSYIRQNCNTMATQQDIYNRIADTKRSVCEGQSSIHALTNQLDKEGF
jgi:hypothetical protein